MIYKILHRKLKIEQRDEYLIDWVTWMKGFNKTIKLNTSFPQIIVKSHSCHDCVSKNFFFFLYKHHYNHLHINELLYKFQSGFPPGYSTTYLLIELYDDILLALDKKKNKLQMTLLLAIPHIMKNKYRFIIFKCMVM